MENNDWAEQMNSAWEKSPYHKEDNESGLLLGISIVLVGALTCGIVVAHNQLTGNHFNYMAEGDYQSIWEGLLSQNTDKNVFYLFGEVEGDIFRIEKNPVVRSGHEWKYRIQSNSKALVFGDVVLPLEKNPDQPSVFKAITKIDSRLNGWADKLSDKAVSILQKGNK